MAQRLPGNPSHHGINRDPTSIFMAEEPQCSSRKWYFSREEIEDHSPSRKDGIDLSMESHLRKLYCSFLKDLGKTLKVPQMTIATAMMFCHRFYLRQSHAKNDWQSVATFSMFLACKVEETPCLLKDVVVVAYELIYRWDPSAPRRIRQKELYEKQKESVVIGERLLLATMAFDLNIEHPYKPLVTALKRLDISHKDIAKVAWNFVNDWLCTTLCLQYKPHYIAAASMFLAAKFHKVKLPTENGKVWWLEFDISPKQLEEVIQHMLRLLEQTRKQTPQSRKVAESTAGGEKVISHSTQSGKQTPQSRKVAESTAGGEKVISHSTQSGKINGSIAAQCSSSGVTVDSEVPCRSVVSKCSERLACGDGNVSEKEALQCQTSDCGSAHSVVEDGDSEIQPKTGESSQNMGFRIVSVNGGYSQIDVNRIREKMKRMQSERAASIKSVHVISDETDNKAWIERELENGIELEYTSAEKKQRRV